MMSPSSRDRHRASLHDTKNQSASEKKISQKKDATRKAAHDAVRNAAHHNPSTLVRARAEKEQIECLKFSQLSNENKFRISVSG